MNNTSMTLPLGSLNDILRTLQAEKPVILIDDEDRENEGDVILPINAATPENIHFLMRYCRGMICLAMENDHAQKLGLQDTEARGLQEQYRTPFMRSIDARNLTDRGGSARDISATIQTAKRDDAGPKDIVTPGHVAPLVARPGGVLVRAGHTEAAVDLARLSGQQPLGVICEIMNDDGTMAHGKSLMRFASDHDIPVFSIAQLISWRLQHDRFVNISASGQLNNRHGAFDLHVYRTSTHPTKEHLVICKGVTPNQNNTNLIPVVRVHILDIMSDACQDMANGRQDFLDQTFRYLADHETGILLIINQTSDTDLSNRIANPPTRTNDEPSGQVWLREYGIGAQILLDMGISQMTLLSHSSPSLAAFSGFGISIVNRVQFPVPRAQ